MSRGYTYNGEGYVHDVRAFDIFAETADVNATPQTTGHAQNAAEENRLPSPLPVDTHAIPQDIESETESPNTSHVFHECHSPHPIDPDSENLSSETGVSRKPDSEVPSAMDPRHNFPMTSEGISNAIGNAKTGDVCFLTWGFDCQTTLSVSKGTVATINRRNVRTKLSMEYIGVQGHKVDNTFKGFLPPHANVRIYKIQWLKKQSAMDKHMNSIPVASPPVTQHTEEDLDLAPMPKLRAIHADFAPCVVAIYRDIMRNYATNSYDDRNDIWNRVLSAMKHSLTVVRTASIRRRRKRPIPDDENAGDAEELSKTEARTIKKATRLALEGCVSKATKVLDQEVRPQELTDDDVCAKLRDLHPRNHENFELPDDSPEIAIISTEELRDAGRRLAKGSAPGPTGTTDTIIRLLLDDEICCVSMCYMFGDLIGEGGHSMNIHRTDSAFDEYSSNRTSCSMNGLQYDPFDESFIEQDILFDE